MRHRLFIGGTVAAIAAAVLALGGALRSGHAAPTASSRAEAGLLGSGFAAGDTEGLVLQLQAGLRQHPGDVHGLGLLGLAYLQRARETGDPAWYGKAGGVLHRALGRAPRDLIATDGLGSLSLSRHRFADALRIGRRPLPLSPPAPAR